MGPGERPVTPVPPPYVAPEATTTYTVVAGDTISGIAQAHGVRTADVLAANGLTMESAKRIRPGQTILIPAGGSLKSSPVRQPGASASPAQKRTIPTDGIHTVAQGEFPGTIAQMYGVTTADLLAANNMTEADARRLKVGQQLKIPTGGTKPGATAVSAPIPPPPPPPASNDDIFGGASAPVGRTQITTTPSFPSSSAASDRTYTVQDGDDVYTVGIKFGVPATELRQFNNLTTSELTPGQTLRIPPQR